MLYNENAMVEITSKLAGVILKKAELDGSFNNVYSAVFERISLMDPSRGDEFLTVLGEIGG